MGTDDTHYDIALACVEKGLHVMVTKPIVKTLVSQTGRRMMAAEQPKA